MNNKSFLIISIFILILARLIPHPPNFTPVIAATMFSAYKFKNRNLSFLIPFISMIISDFIIGFHPNMLSVYFSLILISIISRNFFEKIIICSLFSSIIFYLITNFQVFMQSTVYQKNIMGLVNCYILAFPFFIMTLTSSILFSFLIINIYSSITSLPQKIKI
ncbi:MAG: hypothetical protein CMD07_02345 [Flavobacteriales bacterium]|nr:hypothetical protein [Flavobacteriales bacterium]